MGGLKSNSVPASSLFKVHVKNQEKKLQQNSMDKTDLAIGAFGHHLSGVGTILGLLFCVISEWTRSRKCADN